MAIVKLPSDWNNPLYLGGAIFILATALISVASPRLNLFELLGHASFIATFAAYSQNDLIKLRVIAIVSLLLGLIYNAHVHFSMPQGQGIALVLFWLSVFLLQNLYKAYAEIANAIESSIPASQRLLVSTAFPEMHSKDWCRLSSIASIRTLKKGSVLIKAGDSTATVMLLASGRVEECRTDGLPSLKRSIGTVWGELTWTLGSSSFNASPCEVVVVSDEAEVWEWSYISLDKICRNNQRLLAALRNGFLRSACFKHGLLQKRQDDSPPTWDTSA